MAGMFYPVFICSFHMVLSIYMWNYWLYPYYENFWKICLINSFIFSIYSSWCSRNLLFVSIHFDTPGLLPDGLICSWTLISYTQMRGGMEGDDTAGEEGSVSRSVGILCVIIKDCYFQVPDSLQISKVPDNNGGVLRHILSSCIDCRRRQYM